MPADVNVTEKVARALLGWHPSDLGHPSETDWRRWDEALGDAARALAVLSDPEVLAGVAGVLREHSESEGDASFLPSCRCGWVGSSRMAWAADLARHRATALADWLRGHR